MESSSTAAVSDIVGDFGPWQRKIFVFFSICGIFSAWNALSLSFYAPNIEFWCQFYEQSGQVENLLLYSNSTAYLSCAKPALPSQDEKCIKWQFDTSSYKRTIVQEWDLVCDRSWLVSMSKSVYMMGTFFAVILSQVADRVGRFPVIFGGIILEVIAGLMSGFSTSIEMFLMSRFFLAMGNAARWGSGFVILLELVGSKHRGTVGIAIEFGWAAGYIILPCVAYFVRDFRLLQLCCTMPEIIFVVICWFLIPESPRWLMSRGNFLKAKKILTRGAQLNNVNNLEETESNLKKLLAKYESECGTEKAKKATFFDLWRTPNLRSKTLLLYLTWATNGFIYYGISFNTNIFEGNPYLNFLLSGAVEMPAYLLCIFLLKSSGRKKSIFSSMIVTGISFLLLFVLQVSPGNSILWLKTSLAMIGKFAITCSFAIIYLYSCEVYPTVVRTIGLGSSSMAGRIGSMLAPFVKELGEVTDTSVSLAIFAFLAISNALMVLLFGVDTDGKDIPDTLEEAERECQDKPETTNNPVQV